MTADGRRRRRWAELADEQDAAGNEEQHDDARGEDHERPVALRECGSRHVLADAEPSIVSVTTGAIPASPSSGIRAGAEISMLTVGAVFDAPVIGSVPGSFETTICAAAAISDGDRDEHVARRGEVPGEVLASQPLGLGNLKPGRLARRERRRIERLGRGQRRHVELCPDARPEALDRPDREDEGERRA